MREEEVKELFKDQKLENGWKRFLSWMEGQTMSAYKNGDTDFYSYDVNRFIDIVKNKSIDVWD